MKARKLIAILTAVILVFGCISPLSALAAGEETTVTPAERSQVECQRDGMTLRGTMFVPEIIGDEKIPMVILSHGFMSSQWEMWNLAGALQRAGYASVCFDFMGSGQSDGQFVNMTTWTEVADLNAIIDYVKTLDFVDTDNIFLSGNSFGGVVTALTAVERAADLNAICLWYPAMSMCDDARNGYVQATQFDPNNIPDTLQVGRYTVGREFLEININLYPTELAVAYTDDVLILHGTADNLVPYTSSVDLAEKYESAELVPVEGGGHGFWGPVFNSAAPVMIEFLDAHVNSVNVRNTTASCGEGKTAAVDVVYKGNEAATTVTVQLDSQFDLVEMTSRYDGFEYNPENGKAIIYNIDGFEKGDVLCTALYDLDVIQWAVNGAYKVDVEVLAATGGNDEPFEILGNQGYIIIENDYLDGDITADGKVTNADVITLARYLVDLVEFNADQLIVADFDGNGKINNADLIKLARAIVA